MTRKSQIRIQNQKKETDSLLGHLIHEITLSLMPKTISMIEWLKVRLIYPEILLKCSKKGCFSISKIEATIVISLLWGYRTPYRFVISQKRKGFCQTGVSNYVCTPI